MFTRRSPKTLLRQYDLHAILAVVALDLSLTFVGINGRGGSEANPLYAPLTHSPELMIAGAVFYFVVLGVLSLVLSGQLRYVLASVAFGMHVVGVLTWSWLITPGFYDALNIFWFMLAGTGATALFYRAEQWRTE